MICKKCSAKNPTSEGTHKCCVDGCKFNIARHLKVCLSHSRKRDLCECCGLKIGQTRRKGAEGPNE